MEVTIQALACTVIYNNVGGSAWSTLRDAASGSYAASATGERIASIQADAGGFNWIARGIITFDTSFLGNGVTINSARVRIFGNNKVDTLAITPLLYLASANPTNPSSIGTGDYSKIGRVSFGGISYASFSTSGWNEWMSVSGIINNINKTGATGFSLQIGHDLNNTPPSLPGSISTSTFQIDMADVTNKPELIITYTPLSTGLQMLL